MRVRLRKEVLFHMAHRVITFLRPNYAPFGFQFGARCFVGRGARHDPFFFFCIYVSTV